MANYLASDSDLTSIANAIRTKGGTSASLEFPTDFVSAIANMQVINKASGTVTLASNGTITIPHNLNSLRVVCLVSPTGVMTPGQGYRHMGLVAANYQEIFSAELQNVTYDFSTYNSNYTGAITRTGAYPAGSALKSPWTNRTEAQWNSNDNWSSNVGWCNSTGSDLNITFNLNDIKANSFSKGTYRWEVYGV